MNATVSATDLLKRQVSLFKTVKAAKPQHVPFGEILNEIQSGRWRAPIDLMRWANGARDHLKATLPAMKPSGIFSGRKATDLIEHSGILCLDLDNVGEAAGTITESLRADDHVLAYFTSPRGAGIKVFVPVLARDAATHAGCLKAAIDHYGVLMPNGVKIDPAPSNVASNCFVSFDPDLWRASAPRLPFKPLVCDVSISHVIQSNEKEPSALDASEDLGPRVQSAVEMGPPLVIRLPNFVDSYIWPNWVKREPHRAGLRNESITKRAPILINLVAEDIADKLLLRWYDEAPAGMFKDPRERHWLESKTLIRGCVASWPAQARISAAEKAVYARLRDDRQRATFRILHSLSIAKATKERGGLFFVPTGQLGDRLDCASEPASRQLEYMIRAGAVEIVAPGKSWGPGEKSKAATYRWLLR